jgi:hypothetical protein
LYVQLIVMWNKIELQKSSKSVGEKIYYNHVLLFVVAEVDFKKSNF